MGNWLKRNAVNLIIVAAFMGIIWLLVFRNSTAADGFFKLWNWFLVAAGIGFLIFIHELGHFLAAKLCNVKVETFSVGFGPPIPGCYFRWGETLYKLAWFPLGGYVKMAGEYPNEQQDEETKNDPRAFMNKTVGQRMIIISAGVVFNVILGVILFTIVYLNGKPTVVGRVSYVDPGSPAHQAGIAAGSEILELDGNTKPSFEDVFSATALASPGKTEIPLKWRTPQGEVREGRIVPRKRPTDPKPVLGVGYPSGLTTSRLKRDGPLGLPGSPAAGADLRAGDRLIGIKAASAESFTPLKSGWDFERLNSELRGQPIILKVLRDANEVEVPVGPRFFQTLGIRVEMGPINAMVEPKYAPKGAKDFRLGDVIVAVDGDQQFDPVRLPDLLWQKARAKAEPIDIAVLREGKELTIQLDTTELREHGTWEETGAGSVSPMGIPALGIAYEVLPNIKGVAEGSPAALAGVQPGDRIKSLTYFDKETEKPKTLDLQKHHWPAIFYLTLQSDKNQAVELQVVDQSGNERTVPLTTKEDPTWPHPERGILLEYETMVVTADGPWQAIVWGFRDTYTFVGQIYMNLKGFIARDIDVDLISGPIRILQATSSSVDRGFVHLLLLLGVISINLAVVNFLPIPVLDGGHMVFLIVEKLRGKPASERVLIVANVIGLGVILCLMCFVVYLDISKMAWFRSLFS